MPKHGKNLNFEDTIQCSIYSTQVFNASKWDELCVSINKLISSLSQEYIWHRDDFRFFSCDYEEKRKDIPNYLTSTTCFGDNIEDEWFIVYLVLEITKQYRDLIVQIEDNDGDFLLIEAANYLPSWANPDTTENRVFIYNGKIQIVNPLIVPLNTNLQLNEALQIIKESYEKTEAPTEIQQAILHRIGNYPEKIKTLCHRANVTLPVEIAAVLMLKPSLISPIVTAYCNIDALDIKKCIDITITEKVTVKLKFTKYLYAMLLNSKPVQKTPGSDTENKCHQLGMKITYGYQVITKTQMKDPATTLEYKKFFNSLMKNGYFRNNLEGSKEYKELLVKANNYFLDMESPVSCHVNNIICMLKSTPEFTNSIMHLVSNSINTELIQDDDDDDDEWLNVHPKDLNDLLDSNYRSKANESSEAITSKLSNFLKQTSDFEGIEQRDDGILNDNKIEFDSEEFVKSLEKMLNLISNKCDTTNNNNDFSDDDIDIEDVSSDNDELEQELSGKLHEMPDRNVDGSNNIVNNLIKSIKEEGLSGPSSNILKTIGINKTDLLDSDDD